MNIIKSADLTDKHTFGVPWAADFYIELKKAEQITEILQNKGAKKLFVLGGGSNILPTKKMKGIVIHNQIKGKEVIKEYKTHIFLRVGAGENWHSIVLFCIRNQYYGFENLTLIPGTVGGAVVQNIGAYDVEISRFVHEVEVYSLSTGEKKMFKGKECCFEYRNSIFKYSDEWIVTHVTFKLPKVFKPMLTYKPLQHLKDVYKKDNLTAKRVSQEVAKIRKSKLPDWNIIGTAGSFFANPRVNTKTVQRLQKNYPDMPVFYNYGSEMATIPAGWLIEHSSIPPQDRIEFLYHKHALIVINNQKNMTMPANKGARIKNFVAKVARTVERDFGITLNPEVKIL